MRRTFICHGCGQEKIADPRQKGQQKFCGEPACQRARKARWQKTKMKSDPTYRAQELDALKQWRKERPLHRYQREYRETHPEYVEENRRRQRLRNRKHRREASPEVIVKMDALTTLKSDTYLLRPLGSEKIVKMDALVVELTVLNELSNYDFPASPSL